MTARPRASIVIPAYEEGEGIVAGLDRLLEAIRLDYEILVVVDHPDDSTIAVVERCAAADARLAVLVNTYGNGPAHAIRYGVDRAAGRTVVVTMADGCDDPRQIDDLVRLVERGVVVAAASRYTPGGRQVGGPAIKGLLSRMAGVSLDVLARVGTRDATNSFKAYDAAFVRAVGIASVDGFEIGLELTAKARRLRRPVAEIPTIWLDRSVGESRFALARWIPKYLRWYRFAFGPPLTADQVRIRSRTAPVPRPQGPHPQGPHPQGPHPQKELQS